MAVNQDEISHELAELLGFMQGAMQEFQRSMDELIEMQKQQAQGVSDTTSSAMTLVENLEKNSFRIVEAQKKSLEFVQQHWANGLMEQAREAGQAQANLFGQAIAKEVVKDVKKDLQEATNALSDKTQAFEEAARWLNSKRLIFLMVTVFLSTGILLSGFFYFIPSGDDLLAMRTEKKQLEATLETLAEKGGRMELSHCGSKRRLCVKVDKSVEYENNFMVIHGAK